MVSSRRDRNSHAIRDPYFRFHEGWNYSTTPDVISANRRRYTFPLASIIPLDIAALRLTHFLSPRAGRLSGDLAFPNVSRYFSTLSLQCKNEKSKRRQIPSLNASILLNHYRPRFTRSLSPNRCNESDSNLHRPSLRDT